MKVMKSNSEDSEAITYAIDVVGSANDDSLANQLIEFLLGETDGVPKVMSLLLYVFRVDDYFYIFFNFLFRILSIYSAYIWHVNNTEKQQRLQLLLLMKSK